MQRQNNQWEALLECLVNSQADMTATQAKHTAVVEEKNAKKTPFLNLCPDHQLALSRGSATSTSIEPKEIFPSCAKYPTLGNVEYGPGFCKIFAIPLGSDL
jgi:hypothetical protein